MEILSGEQMRRIDRRAIEELGMTGLQLMESAGRGIAECLLSDYPAARTGGVLVLCGKGNNGGDGLVIARHLDRHGLHPRVVLLAAARELRGDVAHNLARAREAGIEIQEAPDEAAWGNVRSQLGQCRVVLDALLGTGVRGGARGLIAVVIEDLNRAGGHVVSVDMPSGIDADSSEVTGCAVRAERTYTLCRPKVGLVFHPAAGYAGNWKVVEIGIPDSAVQAEGATLEWLDAAAARPLLPGRPAESHKGTYGHLLAVAGSRDKSGAAVLVARAALRCGAGLVTVATALSAAERVAVQQAEVMTEALPETDGGTLSRAASDRVLALARERDAVALGPGLGVTDEVLSVVETLARELTVPLVVDADGLNALARRKGGPPHGAADCSRTVWTPHPGEAARLLGSSTAAVQAARLAAARDLARDHAVTVVLKGHRTLIAEPGGRVAVNSSGNPGMATAGSGDVLTGAVGALLARGLPAWDAARLAVFVHGSAGDLAAARRGQDGLIASDLVEELPSALAALRGAPG